MTAHNPALRIDVADLLTHPAARRAVHLEAPVESLAGSAARVPDDEPIVLDLVLERDAGDAPTVRQQRLDRVLLPDEQHVDTELGHSVERATDNLVRRLVAAHGVDRDGDALRAHVR